MIVYVNGDSYAHVSNGKRYSDFLGEYYNCDVINSAIPGSCNSRIFRTSIRDMLGLLKQHKDIVAVISLTFPMRTEVWDDSLTYKKFTNDGEFTSIQTTNSKSWVTDTNYGAEQTSYKKYSEQWLRWYNVEAETTNLLLDIITFTSWCKCNNVKYVVVSGPLQEPIDIDAPFVKPFYESVKADKNVIDIFNFSFTEWCISNGFSPIDNYTQVIHGKTYVIGHHGESAHKAFATYLMENYLNEV